MKTQMHHTLEKKRGIGSRYSTYLLFIFVLIFIVMLLVPNALGVAKNKEIAKPTFQQALAGYEYSFPRDHGSHDDFLTEWWYFTGHVFSTNGRRFGYELTFFRRAIDDERVRRNSSRWALRQLYFAHLALTDEDNEQFRYAEKISRAGLGKAGANTGTLHTWIDQWLVQAVTTDHRQLRLKANTPEFSINLEVTSQKPPVIHGLHGVSKKGEPVGRASHYYSLTRLATQGELWLNGEQLTVQGTSWMDHEFGSSDLGEGMVGWDWFSVQLESGHEIMAYWLRQHDGTFDPVSSGTLIFPNGSAEHLTKDDLKLEILSYWESKESGTRYPSQWNLQVLPHHIQVTIVPRMANQELRTTKSTQITYWEGAVDVSGTFAEKNVSGMGYVELTGYTEPYHSGS